MAERSSIEWTEVTWNPVTGCDRVSAGCDHCYALTLAKRLKGMGSAKYQNDGDPRTSGPGFGVTTHPDTLGDPLKWRNPRTVFVNSMSDLFHDAIPDEYIAQVFAVMALAPQHTFQVLTKRHGRMRSLLNSENFDGLFEEAWCRFAGPDREEDPAPPLPLLNVWLGVSVEDQQWADIRIPALLDTLAAVRWLSCEPLLGPINLDPWRNPGETRGGPADTRLGWVVCGGESGPGARPMHPDWARSLRDQCTAAGVPFFFKQWGDFAPADVFDHPGFTGGRAYNHPRGGCSAAVIREPGPSGTMRTAVTRLLEPGERTRRTVLLDRDTIAVSVGKKRAGRELDGRTWDEYPAVSRV